MVSLIGEIQKTNLLETESRLVVVGAGGRGANE